MQHSKVYYSARHLYFVLNLSGILEIHGDVTRDIVLSLKDPKAPVQLTPGTKNITLTRKLDREGIDGPSSVTFTVLCDKRNHNEPVRKNFLLQFNNFCSCS
jgi:hypothetical protein